MKEQVDLKNILKAGKLKDELELERALILDRKLRLIVIEHPELADARKKLRAIIKSYEKLNWSNANQITDEQIIESDNAAFIAEQERVFLDTRKNEIKKRISELNLTQQDLGKLLGHGKTYMSELMNGISPFTMRDIVILHRLLHIKLEKLIPTIISSKDRIKIKSSLSELKNIQLKLENEELVII
jgi:transcriptional regulator with XRE-family HTH domain